MARARACHSRSFAPSSAARSPSASPRDGAPRSAGTSAPRAQLRVSTSGALVPDAELHRAVADTDIDSQGGELGGVVPRLLMVKLPAKKVLDHEPGELRGGSRRRRRPGRISSKEVVHGTRKSSARMSWTAQPRQSQA